MPESVETAPRTHLPSWLYRSGSVFLYFFLTCLLYGFDLFNNAKIIQQPGTDQVQEVWFLAWPAYAFTHFLDPFQSTWMNFPWGVNMMTNTSMPLLGFVGMPLTWVFGPVVTYTFLMRMAFVCSAASVQFVARRVGISRPAALAAGLLYGFSTIQIAQGYGHLFLAFAALPPLIFYSVYCLLIGRWSGRRAGITIGALFAADFLISAERALMTAIVLVIVAVLALVFSFRSITRELFARVGVAALWSLGVGLLILVIPLIEMTGHAHVAGAAHPWIQSYETDLQAIFFPSAFTWFHPFPVTEAHGLAVQVWENGAYLGIPLIALFFYGTIRGWSSRLVRIGSVATLVVLGLSMGEVLKINGVKTSLHSPYKILTTIKYVENILPVRFMYFVWLGVALIGAYGLDLIVRRPQRPGAHERAGVAGPRVALAVAVFALVAITLVPARPYPMVDTGVPPWLLSSEAARVIPADSVALYYPYPQFESNHGMLNQAVGTFHYKIVGGEAIVGDVNGKPVGIVPLEPLALPSVFIRAYSCFNIPPAPNLPCATRGGVSPHSYYLPPMPALNAATITQFHRFIVRNQISTIVMEASYTYGGKIALPYLTAAFGQPLVRDDGLILVWTKPMLDARSLGL